MKPVFTNSSPNTESDDVLLAVKELLKPQNWSSDDVAQFEYKIAEDMKIRAAAFDSARSSFYAILKAWGIQEGDEVIVPAFTCVVIVNPILWLGAKPVYVDINKDTFNTDLEKIKEKVTEKTKVILAQHTFGKPMTDIEEIVEFAHSKNIKVVEDCAHTLGLTFKGRHLGTFGDAGVITFGMTKVISGVRGGMAITSDIELMKQLIKFRSTLPSFPLFKAKKLLLNPLIWHLIPPIYYLGKGKYTLGRIIVVILQALKIISINNIVEESEEEGLKPGWIPTKMSKSLSILAVNQYKKINKLNEHRRKIARIYAEILGDEFDETHLYLRYPVYVRDKQRVLKYFREKRVILGDWYKAILHIPQENYEKLQYIEGTCPSSEVAASQVVNLPTFIKMTEEQARFIAEEIKQFRWKRD